MKTILSILLLFIISAQGYGQAPLLTSPADNSRLQHAVNLQLVWQSLPGNPVYQVQYSQDDSFTPGTITGDVFVTGTTLTIDRLSNNRTYYWRVRINQQDAPWSEVWSFTTTGLPVTPIIFSPANTLKNRDTDLFFNWNRHENNFRYILQLSTSSTFSGNNSNFLVNDTFYVAQDLDNNTTYFWRVKALNVDNIESSWSEVFQFKTVLSLPSPVFPRNNTRNQQTNLLFRWNTSETATSYRFQLARDSLFTQSSILSNIERSITEVSITSLSYNTFYYWRVIAYNGAGDSSAWTPVHNFRTVLAPPLLFQNPDSLRNRDTSFVISWGMVTADDFVVQLSTDPSFDELLSEEVVFDTVYTIDSLEYNKRYYWRLLARNENGDSSSWNTVEFKTRLKTPLATTPSRNSRNVSPEISFRWESIPGADQYRFRLAQDSLFSNPIRNVLLTDTFYNAGTLLFDTTYYWQVLAFNALGDSSKLEAFRFRTRPPLLLSLESLNTFINLSQRRTDSLTTVTISNIGENPFIIDSIKTFPDTLFVADKQNAVVMPDEEESFEINFIPGKIDTGLTHGAVYFIRRNELNIYDTLAVEIRLYIEKAVASFSDSSLVYDSTDAGRSILKEVNFKNFGGNLSLRVDSIIITGPDSTAFSVTETFEEPGVIPPGDSASYFFEFTPQTYGRSTATALIITNAYPDTVFSVPLTGSGRGGELSATTLARVSSLSDSVFEAFTENDKPVVFTNTGNAPMNVSVRFAQDKFKVENDFQRNFTVRRGDSVSLNIKYMIPDFSESVKDTMRIIHNGFGEDTLVVFLEGTFDSLESSAKIQSELRLNGNVFSLNDKVINENTSLAFTMDPELLNGYQHLSFRINYFTGGHGNRILAENNGSFSYIIPRELVDEKGLLFSAQLIAKDNTGKPVDSITIFTPVNVQVVLKDYQTIDINVPRSVPAEREEDANTKWIMFGFPFEEVVADSVFKDLGGIDNMKDGEWIIYSYEFTVPDSFIVFNDYSFTPNKAYFAAQSLSDTFKISYNYKENLRTRKLTDSILTLPGTNWKTVSSPFLFDVEVDPNVMLRRYDTNNKTYRMTNIMKPGEGYFVEPSVSQVRLKTFGEYNPLFYPKIMADIGWHIKVKASGKNSVMENIFSVESSDKLNKSGSALPKEYASSPVMHQGFELYTKGDKNKQLEASVKNGTDGAVFNIVLLNKYTDETINLSAEITGNFPGNYFYKVYNEDLREVISLPAEKFFIKKDKQYNLKLIVGTEAFVNKTLAELNNQVPGEFALIQNYPNPFNPATTISYHIAENSFVSIVVYDILGKEVTKLVNEEKTAGYYKLDFNAAALASGVYFYRLSAGNFVSTKKMILLK